MNPRYHEFFFSAAGRLNQSVIDGYRFILESGEVKKSHLFEGRYENIYVEREAIPEISDLITFWIDSAAAVLGMNADELQCGFWFNDMRPGDVTLPHTHNDDDELLSGVYYLEIPENSGELVLYHDKQAIRIQPVAGKLVLFSATDEHEVSKNLSEETRLSIGINFGSRRT